ncbi:MAG TPA: histidine phosphatase family protein [Ottowia sp.]|uniref:histidine phosphatase family protein n=1 Tax=Ottowia sp. TaxID=1898956 RepID=UPI002D08354D|nr:histidine phosphatase family protein [Ottowia sp.]HMN21759.1 histidine phosphatase family protein [Ottowia sp.]
MAFGVIRWTSVVLVAALAQSGALAQDDLWQRLATGERLVVLMRHAQSAGGDPVRYDASGQCQGENMLTQRGRFQAQAVGQRFAQHKVPVVQVIHSPMCRTRDTGQLAFAGVAARTDPDLREIASADAERRQAFLQSAARLLRDAPEGGATVFISHAPNLFEIAMESVPHGVGLVGQVDERGEFSPLGLVRLDE